MSPNILMFVITLVAALVSVEQSGSTMEAPTQEASTINASTDVELSGTLVAVDGDTATYVLPWVNKSTPPIVEVRIREKATSDAGATRLNHQAWEGVVSIDCHKRLFMRPNGGLFYYSDGTTASVSEGPIGPSWTSLRATKWSAIRLIARQVCKLPA